MRAPLHLLAAGFVACLNSLPVGAQTVTLESITIGTGADIVKLPRVVFEDANLGEAELRALFDPGRLDTVAERFRRLTARRVSVPEAAFAPPATPAATEVVRFGGLTFTDLREGRARTMRVAPLSLASKDPGGVTSRTDIGEIGADDVDVGLLLAMLGNSNRPDTSQPKQTLYRNAFAESLLVDLGGEGTVRLGRINGGDVRFRPMQMSLARFASLMDPTKAPQSLPSEALRQFLVDYAEMLDASEWSASDIDSVEVRLAGAGADVVTGVQVKKLRFMPLENAVLAGAAAEGIELKLPDGSIRLSTFVLKAIDLRSFVVGVRKLGAAEPAEWLAANWRDVLPAISGFSLDGLSVDVPDETAGQRFVMSVAKADLALSNHILGIPSDVSISSRESLLDLAKSGDSALAPMVEMGFKTLKWSDSLRLTWDEGSQSLRLAIDMDIDKFGNFSFEGAIGNVPPELFGKDLALIQAAVLGAAFRQLSLNVVNRQGLEAVLAMVAKAQGTTAEALRPQWAGMALGLPQLLGGAAGLTESGQALSKFITNGKSLNIMARAKASSGVGLGEVLGAADPLDLLEKVEIRVTAD